MPIDLCKLETFKHIQEAKDLQVLSTILINMSFTWAMTWINLPKQFPIDRLLEQQNLFIDNAATQVRFTFPRYLELGTTKRLILSKLKFDI